MFVLSLVVALLPATVAAAGETYSFKDDAKSAITATGGSYASPVTFSKSGTKYVAQAPVYTCADGSTNGTSVGTATLTGSGTTYKLDNSKVILPAGCTIDPVDTSITVAAANLSASGGDTDSCDQGSFTWFACPIMGNIASTIATIAKDGLQTFLEVSPLKSGSDSPLYTAWAHIRDFADVLFIVIFLLIIFSTSIQSGFDQYTIRKMLPRLVVAVVLVQVSYFLAGILVDTGNVLGSGVNDLLVSVVHPSDGDKSIANVFANIGEMATGLALAGGAFVAFSTGFWVAALPILLGILISIVVVLITLGARYIVLALLVILSPLAMVAWVLPNTEKYFHKWLSALLRLIMMYPIIMGILSVAGHINQLLPFDADGLTTGPGAVLIAIMKPLIIIAAFSLIPLTFRWAGAAVGNSHRFIQGLGGRANGALKSSGFAADGRAQRDMNRTQSLLKRQNRALMLRDPEQAQRVMAQSSGLRNVANRFEKSGFGQKTHGARMWTRGMALGTTNSNGLALQRSYNSQFKQRGKGLNDLEDSEATFGNLQTAIKGMYGASSTEKRSNMATLSRTAPSLMNYTKTVQGRAAIVRKLSEMKGIDDDLTRRMMEDDKGMYEYNQFIGNKAAKGDPKEKPTITFARSYDSDKPQNTNFNTGMAAGRIQGLGANGFSNDFDAANWIAATGRVTGRDDTKTVSLFARDELSETIAKTILDNASYSAVGATFDPTNRNFSDKNKRAAIVRMLKANEDLATEGNAKLVRDGILKQVIADEVRDANGDITNAQNTDIYDGLIEQAVRSDGFKGNLNGDNDTVMAIVKGWGNDESGTAQKRAFIRRWLGIP